MQKFSNGETYPYELKALAAYDNNSNLECMEEIIEKINQTNLLNYLFSKISKIIKLNGNC